MGTGSDRVNPFIPVNERGLFVPTPEVFDWICHFNLLKATPDHLGDTIASRNGYDNDCAA